MANRNRVSVDVPITAGGYAVTTSWMTGEQSRTRADAAVMVNEPDCAFCDIVTRRTDATWITAWPEAIAIRPNDPVADGHVLIIPRQHVNDAVEDPVTSASVMRCASRYAQRPSVGPCNIITSVGAVATQTVFHLHVHVVPRRADDGLRLPWTST